MGRFNFEKNPTRTSVTVRVDEEIAQEILKIAEKVGSTVPQVAKVLLEVGLEEYRKEKKL